MSANQNIPFKKFGSIKNVDSLEGNKYIVNFGKLEAVAMEKAHGAHFSFQTNGKYIECAKRGSVLTPDEKFYNHQEFKTKYSSQIFEIFSEINSMLENIQSIQVDGEYIGGSYSHPDIEQDDRYCRIQKGVSYCPNHEFYAYDIRCFRVESDGTESSFYVDYDVMALIFEKVGILYAKPVARGTFAEMCRMSNIFESIIPSNLSFPQIESNQAEGLVIRPVIEHTYRTGSRIILKSKNKKFCEVINTKRNTTKTSKNKVYIDPNIANCIDSMVNMNRLDSVISKIGEVTRADFGRLMRDLNIDILKDFPDHYPEEYDTIGEKEWPSIKKYLNTKCSDTIHKYFSD